MGESFLQIIIDIFYKATPGVITAGLLTAIGYLFQKFITDSRVKRSTYSGIWYGYIFDDNGTIKKSDNFIVSENRRNASGKVIRTFPRDETERNWVFKGRIQNHSFIATYWSDDEINMSSGIWLLKQYGENVFLGYYYRLEESGAHDPRRIGAFRMVLRKDKELSASEYANFLDLIPEMRIHTKSGSNQDGITILQ